LLPDNSEFSFLRIFVNACALAFLRLASALALLQALQPRERPEQLR